MQLNIIDSIMGTGKTTYIMDMMIQNPDKNYLYITPYLTEVDRVVNYCHTLKFKQPEKKQSKDTKLSALRKLLEQNQNIVSTHQLFMMMDPTIMDIIKKKQYTLIIDEVADFINVVDISKSDAQLLINGSIISIDDQTKKVTVTDDSYNGQMNDFIRIVKKGLVSYYRNCVFLWQFPVEFIRLFSNVYILTYLFDSSSMKCMLEMHKYSFKYYYVQSGQLVEFDGKNRTHEICQKKKYIDLISIYQNDDLNFVGDKKTAFSKNWINTHREMIKPIKRVTYNFFKYRAIGKSNQNMWSTYKLYRDLLKGDGYTNGFVAFNCRATNEYKDKSNVALLVNIFQNPLIKGYFGDHGVKCDEDLLALSTMLQFIWRSQIRNDLKINLFIPSKRMRNLFLRWLSN